MPQFAANLSLMFTEWDFLDRFAAAADSGFQAVEVQFPYDHAPEAIGRRLDRARLTLVLLNAPPGDYETGDRGLAALPGRALDFRISIARAKLYAEATGARRVHVMAGVAEPDRPGARQAYLDSLRFALDALDDLDVLIEPLNPRDMPGYYLSSFDAAAGVIADVGSPRLKLQYDIYHRQILHGDVLTSLEAMLPIVGHVQIACVPGRNEPGGGELDDDRILNRLDALGYGGYVGCEYHPAKGTLAGLGWLEAWRKRRDRETALKSTWREKL
jgi:hydroxypyruvate isomerase